MIAKMIDDDLGLVPAWLREAADKQAAKDAEQETDLAKARSLIALQRRALSALDGILTRMLISASPDAPDRASLITFAHKLCDAAIADPSALREIVRSLEQDFNADDGDQSFP